MRAAIYARYSTDLQSEASIDDQVRLCREKAEREGWQITENYTDYAISGGTLNNRPGMLSLLEAAKRGAFDILHAEALDRISRDQEDIAAIFKRLNHAGVKIVTLAEGEVNELHIGLKGTMNALFLKDLAAKIKRGQRGRVEAGKIPGGKSYGYCVVKKLRDDGTITTGEREIDPDQATIISRIYAEYVAGLSARQIASRLNAENIPGPTGGLWNASSINGSRRRRNGILNNELYLGRIVYNRQRCVKDPDTGKRKFRVNPESEWVRTDVPHLRIISDATWDAARAIKSRYASQAGNRRQNKKRLLTGLVRCGDCGGGMTIIRHDRYYCSAKRERGTCDSSIGIAASELESRVLEGLSSILLGREDLLETFTQEFNAELARLKRARNGHARTLNKKLKSTQTAISRCLKFIKEGDGDPGLVRDELRELEQRKLDLEAQLTSVDETCKIEPHPKMYKLFRKKVQELQTLLLDETSKPKATEIIRSLVDHIEIKAGDNDKSPEVILVGALANILAYGQENGHESLEPSRTFLMVAEEGLEPPTRGL